MLWSWNSICDLPRPKPSTLYQQVRIEWNLFLLFLHFHSFSSLSCPSVSYPLQSFLSLFPLGDDTKWPTRVDISFNCPPPPPRAAPTHPHPPTKSGLLLSHDGVWGLTWLPLMLGWVRRGCSACHRDNHLILAYSLARPAVLAAGKGKEGTLFLLFLHFLSFSSLFPISLFHLHYSIPSPFLWETTKWPTRIDMSSNPNTINARKLISML